MGIFELLTLALALSMDAFAVAICQGLTMDTIDKKQSLTIGLYFGTFQAVMPLIGWALGSQFQRYIAQIDHWVAFILLGCLGVNMVLESLKPSNVAKTSTHRELLLLAIATSIDALTVGIMFAFLDVAIVPSVVVIGVCTFVISIVGVCIGSKFGARYESKAKRFGGIVLILLGAKILIEHLT